MHTRIGWRLVLRRAVTMTALVTAFVLLAVPAWATLRTVPDPTWGTNGRVRAILRVGNYIYLGGEFTAVRSPSGELVARNYLAALDAVTGEPLSWAPNPNAKVLALEASADGSRIYAGGHFNTVDGVAHQGVVALDSIVGTVDPSFNVNAYYHVKALEMSRAGDRLYLGGSFTKLTNNGETLIRDRLAAVDLPANTVSAAWQPSVNETVRALRLSADGSMLYTGGDFTAAGGTARNFLAAFDPTTGALVPAFAPKVPADPLYCGAGCVQDLAADTQRVYVAVGGKSPGNQLLAVNAGTGAFLWRRQGDGDFQAVAVDGGRVYGGGHFDSVGRNYNLRKFIAVNAGNGYNIRGYTAPSFTGGYFGPFAITVFDGGVSALDKLYVGGDFTEVSGKTQYNFAQFSDDGT